LDLYVPAAQRFVERHAACLPKAPRAAVRIAASLFAMIEISIALVWFV
jgi:hypothetical protein